MFRYVISHVNSLLPENDKPVQILLVNNTGKVYRWLPEVMYYFIVKIFPNYIYSGNQLP
jgi:hypothetical protein